MEPTPGDRRPFPVTSVSRSRSVQNNAALAAASGSDRIPDSTTVDTLQQALV